MKKLKQSLIVWISIYPVITLLLIAFGDLLNQLPILWRTLILTLVLVPMMVYILIPFWTKIINEMEKKYWRS